MPQGVSFASLVLHQNILLIQNSYQPNPRTQEGKGETLGIIYPWTQGPARWPVFPKTVHVSHLLTPLPCTPSFLSELFHTGHLSPHSSLDPRLDLICLDWTSWVHVRDEIALRGFRTLSYLDHLTSSLVQLGAGVKFSLVPWWRKARSAVPGIWSQKKGSNTS